MRYLNPTELLITAFGPTKAEAARKLGISRQNLENWLKPRKLMEAGTVPASKHKEVLTRARDLNIPLTPNDLIFGRALE
jgi:hypothetical protein